ncbi:hypothetical protein NPIL_163281 [Nephila pilipes]|uniref:Uncharacterized protein n=1 Tax=Nephila pilipes TaxID=299642 RepID=A0A8X6PAU9_NEPPI|nr:hypothetical protein NPIL_163281 [Nephila pilipes]
MESDYESLPDQDMSSNSSSPSASTPTQPENFTQLARGKNSLKWNSKLTRTQLTILKYLSRTWDGKDCKTTRYTQTTTK